jgi:hypothetical protein
MTCAVRGLAAAGPPDLDARLRGLLQTAIETAQRLEPQPEPEPAPPTPSPASKWASKSARTRT